MKLSSARSARFNSASGLSNTRRASASARAWRHFGMSAPFPKQRGAFYPNASTERKAREAHGGRTAGTDLRSGGLRMRQLDQLMRRSSTWPARGTRNGHSRLLD